MRAKKGIWKNFKSNNDEQMTIKEPIFNGAIVEVHAADTFTIKNDKTKERMRVTLTNLKSPKPGNPKILGSND